jgi:plastocyanin
MTCGRTIRGVRTHQRPRLAATLALILSLVVGGSTAAAAPSPGSTPPVVRTAATMVASGHAPEPLPSGQVVGTWYTNPLSLITLLAASPTLARTFFDRPASFEWEGSVPVGWTTTPYVSYGSYARFADDVAGGTPPEAPVVMYDPEKWNRDLPSDLRAGAPDPAAIQTPGDEQRHPAKYMRLFGELAHELGYRVIITPGLNLVDVEGAHCVRRPGERAVAAYLRCRLARSAAAAADEIDVQFQAEECNTTLYAADLRDAARQARNANPQVKVLSGLSTGWCVPSGLKLLAAHLAVEGVVAGHFLAVFPAGQVAGGDFLNLLAPVMVGPAGFTPDDLVVPEGATVTWRVDGTAGRSHSITDGSGLGLFDSGLLPPGTRYRHRYPGGGTYATRDRANGMRGWVSVPAAAEPAAGDASTDFTIGASSAAAPAGFVYVTQVRRPGSTNWMPWRTGTVNTFVPDAGAGTYAFRVRLERKGADRSSGWSPAASIAVG